MNRENGKRSNFRPSTPKYLRFFATVSQLTRTPLRDQSVFITWGGPEEFRRGSLEIGLPKGGFTHLKILVDGGGFKKYIYCPLVFAILISNVS